MPQPIMKKYTQGEMGQTYGLDRKEKPSASMTNEYKQGEFSDAGGKSANAKPASWSKAKITQGSHNS